MEGFPRPDTLDSEQARARSPSRYDRLSPCSGRSFTEDGSLQGDCHAGITHRHITLWQEAWSQRGPGLGRRSGYSIWTVLIRDAKGKKESSLRFYTWGAGEGFDRRFGLIRYPGQYTLSLCQNWRNKHCGRPSVSRSSLMGRPGSWSRFWHRGMDWSSCQRVEVNRSVISCQLSVWKVSR